jgi:hypothetical protein
VTTEVFFGNSVARAEYESHGAVKTLDPEWLRTGNRNSLGTEIGYKSLEGLNLG